VPELEEIEKRFASAPDPGFRARAAHEYGIIRSFVRGRVEFKTARVLDFGCGAAIAAASIALRHPRATVFGADVVQPDRDRLQTQFDEQAGLPLPENLSLFMAESGTLPREICDLDLIYAWSVFEHVDFEQITDVMRLIRERLSAKGVVLLQIKPLYFSPWGSHLYRYDSTPWVHLLQARDVLKNKVMSSNAPAVTKMREWQQFESLNKATADDIKEAAQRAGFSVLREERLPTREKPPPRLLRLYSSEALTTEELRLLLG